MKAVFLSASVPRPDRDPKYLATSNVPLIRDAVEALVARVVPAGLLVWGGHPAIAPVVRQVAERTGSTQRVETWQSEWFRGQVVDDTLALPNIRWTPKGADLLASLALMRTQMFQRGGLLAAVFIGGMEGIAIEHDLFLAANPGKPVYPIGSTGGAAALMLPQVVPPGPLRDRLQYDLRYDALFEDLIPL